MSPSDTLHQGGRDAEAVGEANPSPHVEEIQGTDSGAGRGAVREVWGDLEVGTPHASTCELTKTAWRGGLAAGFRCTCGASSLGIR